MGHTVLVNNSAEVINGLTAMLEESVNGDKKVLFLMPGGSAAPIATKIWQNLSEASKANITLSLTDERFGAVGHQDSNWKLLQELGVDVNEPRHIPVLGSLPDIQATAADWATRLNSTVEACDSVVALFGIGADNHIAGIKPSSPAVAEQNELTSAYQGEDFARITISPIFFENINKAAIYTEGPSKAEAVKSLENTRDYRVFPDELVKRCGSFVVYYKA